MNPDLLYRVALIPDDTWTAGPDAVAEAIREIEAEFGGGNRGIPIEGRIEQAIAKTPYGERIEINPDTGRFRAVPDSGLPGDTADYVARKISGAVALFDDDRRNQYTALAPELDILRRALRAEPRLPVELFDACLSVSSRVGIHVRIGNLPEPETDPALSDFLARLRGAAADILAHDPKTRDMVERRSAVFGNDALVEARDIVIAGANELARQAEGVLADDLIEDAAIASDAAADPEERGRRSYRLVSRIVEIAKVVGLAGLGVGALVVAAVKGAREIAEAIPVIQTSPHFRQLVEVALHYLGL